MKDYKMKL